MLSKPLTANPILYKVERKLESLLLRLRLCWLALRAIGTRRRAFLDCGSNQGQGYSFFRRFFPPRWFDPILVEPNPNCVEVLRSKYKKLPNLELIERAAWTEKSTLKLFGLVENGADETSVGASVVPEHNSGRYEPDFGQALEVETFRLADYLLQMSAEYDYIVLKLDIESAEYAVLRDLLDTGAAKCVRHIFVEFHSEYFAEEEQAGYRALESQLIRELKDLGVGVTLWL